MRWWPVPALFLCLVAGYLLGSTRREPEPARAARPADARGADHGGPMLPLPEAPREAAAPGPRAPTPDVVVAVPDPASTTEGTEGQGLLVVDFTGFDGPEVARVEEIGIDGNLDFCEGTAGDDHRCSFALYPGEVLVRWEDRGAMRRFAARARVEVGRVTRLLAADPRHAPLPDTPGLAVLDVRVAATDGGWLADIDVSVAGRALGDLRSIDVLTDPEGRARFRVRPGTYEVEVGDLLAPVTLGAGERRALEIGHDAHGEVVVDPAPEGLYSLRALAKGDQGSSGRLVGGYGEPVRFDFVRPGSYELCYTFTSNECFGTTPDALPDPRVLATLDVRAGRAEHAAHNPEPGFLEIHVDAAGAPATRLWQVRLLSERDGTEAALDTLQPDAEGLGGRTAPVAKGRYKVELLADGEAVLNWQVVIGYGRTRLDAKVPG